MHFLDRRWSGSENHRMSGGVTVTLVRVGVPVLVLATLTALGELRRGLGVGAAAGAGLFFPVTWAVWYVRDRRALAPQTAARHPSTRLENAR